MQHRYRGSDSSRRSFYSRVSREIKSRTRAANVDAFPLEWL